MKKGLSVLLIAAALFGFYGGATSLTDVLASKDYWEEEGERSTADMNKLEDGLNQLKDNEQAYLDGQKQLADGEKKLAEGEAQYAQGLADYAAAPAKLAQGERDLAAGKAQLAQGYADYAAGKTKLANAIASRAALYDVRNKISAVESAYSPWLQKFNKLVASIVDNPKKPSKGVLYDAGATSVGLRTVQGAFGTIKEQGETGLATVRTMAENAIIASIGQEAWEAMSLGQQEQAINNTIEATPQLKAGKEKAEAMIGLAAYLDGKFSSRLKGTADNIDGDIATISAAEYQATALRKSKLNTYAGDAEAVMTDLKNDRQVQGAAQKYPEEAAQLIGGIDTVLKLSQAAQQSTAEYNSNYDELKPDASMGRNIGSKVAAASKAILSNTDIVATMTGAQRELI